MENKCESKILVSIIIPLYKGQQYITKLKEMIVMNAKNLYEQTQQRIELILVNDYPDEYINEVEISEVDVLCLNLEKNQGIHGARISGLQVARGEYVVFLDQDDNIDPKYIVSQIKYIKNSKAVLCNGIYRENRLIYGEVIKQNQVIKLNNYIQQPTTIISPGQVLLKKDCIPKMWVENIMKNNGIDDCFLWILLMKSGIEFEVNPEVIYRHNENAKNTSFNWKNMSLSRKEMIELFRRLEILSDEEYMMLEQSMRKSTQKAENYIILDELWNNIEERKILMSDFLINEGYNRIAIYGMGVYGLKFLHALERDKVEVCYGIDQHADTIKCDLKLLKREVEYPEVDIIINSAVFANDAVKKYVQSKTNIPVIGLDEILKKALERV